jgi:hypothetical protein
MPIKFFNSRRLVIVALALLLFVASGYMLSDDLFFKRLIRQNNITTPEEAYAFVDRNTEYPIEGMPLALMSTPRGMLTRQKYLYCSQSAILLATIVNKLGYETRLVDLYGDDGASHHTILEVKQGGGWKTYDTVYKLQGAPYQQSAKIYDTGQYYNVRPVHYSYPTSYNWVIQNNFYLKHLALWLRRLPG